MRERAGAAGEQHPGEVRDVLRKSPSRKASGAVKALRGSGKAGSWKRATHHHLESE